MGLGVYSGNGGFYHWGKLKNGITADDLNNILFKSGAAILKGNDCDMERKGKNSLLNNFFRFSFGSLHPKSFDNDIKILSKALLDIGQ